MKNSIEGEIKNHKNRLINGLWLLVPLIFLAAIILLFFNRLIFSNLILAVGDPFLYFYPYWDIAAEAINEGRIPLWNPNIFMGVPFLANSQVGLFYPLNWPVWLMFQTPYAFSASAVIHVSIGGIGTFLAARKCLKLGKSAALFSAFLFSLGGYFTAQVEHINQLQGLAWLPWYLVFLCRWKPQKGAWRRSAKLVLSLSALFALQLLAGHLQAVLISVVFAFVWQFSHFFAVTVQQLREPSLEKIRYRNIVKEMVVQLLPLVIAFIFGVTISAVQLIPTFELTQLSSRQGGLPINEALSFSLHPLLFSRALLPNYDGPQFIEYVAVLPITALLLAIIGAWLGKRRTAIASLITLAVLGLFLAIGLFNPINHLLFRIPVFNLFRVPARWLVLYALAMALLAGAGLDLLIGYLKPGDFYNSGRYKRPLIIGISVVVVLIVGAFISMPLATYIPVGAETNAVRPSFGSLIFWLVELSLFTLLMIFAFNSKSWRLAIVPALLVLSIIALFAGTRNLPYNNPTTPEAFFDLRPPVLRLQSEVICEEPVDDCENINGRFLGMSEIFFDVGDQPEIDAIYKGLLSEVAQYNYTVAIKQKEVIAPNLPMIYDVASVDGFDGGLLPLKRFNDLTGLMLADGVTSTDGRLRENLSSVPEARWLDLLNTQYVITDKVGDSWRNDVFFDLQFPTTLSAESDAVNIGHVPPFEATELWLLVEGEAGDVDITFTDALERDLEYIWDDENLVRVIWSRPGIAQRIKINPCRETVDSSSQCADEWRLLSLALVDSRDGAFQPLVNGEYRLIHSGDVKVYENLDVLPRAFLIYDWIYSTSTGESLQIMDDPQFNPRRLAVISGKGSLPPGEHGDGNAEIVSYEPEKVVINVESDMGSLLVLTDSNYPGWRATIDKIPAPIFETDILFRGVFVPEGKHVVEFTFEPTTFTIGLVISIASVLLWICGAGFLFWQQKFSR